MNKAVPDGSPPGRFWLRAQGSGHRAQGSGLRAQGTEHRTQGTGHRAQSTGHRAQGETKRLRDCKTARPCNMYNRRCIIGDV